VVLVELVELEVLLHEVLLLREVVLCVVVGSVGVVEPCQAWAQRRISARCCEVAAAHVALVALPTPTERETGSSLY
jgi:hypothetical protein